jgi:hypothetical protein
MSTKPLSEGDWERLRLEVLSAYKEHFALHEPVARSPFSHTIVRYDTVVGDEEDVADIHDEVRREIRKEVREIREGDDRSSRVVVLVGAPGMGKSHLINYFRQPQRAEQLGYVLVCNSNHWRASEFEEVLLDWILDALTRPSLDQPHLLLEKIHDLAFTALEQILQQSDQIQWFTRRRTRRWYERLWAKLRGSDYESIHKKVQQRDPSVFRRLDFPRFARYLCDRFLKDTANPFHRYVLYVLLRYLFAEEREKVLHWLRRRPVDGHFLRVLGMEDQIDRHFKVFDTIKILISMFTPEVARALAGPLGQAVRDKVFFFAFDQIEGRQELFEEEKDWFKFFAQLSELYNALPNVFILFTMTTGLRNQLHHKMEIQFRDRVRSEQRFILGEISETEVLALYRQRIHCCVKNALPEVRDKLQQLGDPYLPFASSQVVEMAQRRTIRSMLEQFDQQFREALDDMPIAVPLDYRYTQKELRLEEEQAKANTYTKSHLQTVHDVFVEMGETMARSADFALQRPEWRQTEEKLPVLRLHFSDPQDSRRWVRVFLVQLPFVFNKHLKPCVNLLFHRERSRYQLWFVRSRPIELSEEVTQGKEKQIFSRTVQPGEETNLRAALRTYRKQEGYRAKEWEGGEPYLIEEVRHTYLGDMLAQVASMLAQESDVEEPEEDPDLVPVTADPQKLFTEQDVEEPADV